MLIEMIEIAGGNFQAGSSESEISEYLSRFQYAFSNFTSGEAESWFLKQYPKKAVVVEAFHLAKVPVTNELFARYEVDVFHTCLRANIGKPQAPVEGVSYFEALAFCQWAREQDGLRYRLPTESEWEYAASSRGKYRFPWGDHFEAALANTAEGKRGETSDVSLHLAGASEQGVLDLAGNVEEWTADVYLPYPGGVFIADQISREADGPYPILRGGSYAHHGDLCLATRRHGYRKGYAISGFRIASTSAVDCERV
jgi:formylglycine-generating enzyme required for sulfatase activity